MQFRLASLLLALTGCCLACVLWRIAGAGAVTFTVLGTVALSIATHSRLPSALSLPLGYLSVALFFAAALFCLPALPA